MNTISLFTGPNNNIKQNENDTENSHREHTYTHTLFTLGYCFTPYQRLRPYNGATFSRLLRHAGDTEDVFSA